MFLKFEAKAFQAGYFLNIFLSFWGLFSYKFLLFSDKQNKYLKTFTMYKYIYNRL